MSEDPAQEAPYWREWTRGEDGLWHRRGARVLVLAGAPGDGPDEVRLLLLRGHDVDQPQRSWWFTVGGGIGDGEEPAAAAVRELAEETGLLLAAEDLVGPVVERTAVFDFYARTCRQDELIYLAWVPAGGPGGREPELSRAGWTAVEQESVDELRWWRLADLAAAEAAGVEVFPEGLAGLVAGLLPAWDGVVRRLGRGRG
ncbi:NUDIX hydrolase [Quadrisphaera sp. DSM 44207]|uniref:NUDIX hydrolase n=1 Tax=Quadrisphaera sp. DSM 44207 TaxID=1881057 RepID=UPI000881FD7A|nr:NUDIX domain-containing protein [Quadrisphaera sp. DSM 44207]SDQ48330.1 NUDIX domain-containing protein [Quadrisphaera sp. DSM 44207]